jgi:hypothetical protein
MKKSISAKQKKRGRGRPATGVTPMVGLRMPPEMRAQVEKLARKDGITLSKAILQIIEKHLPQRGQE